VNYNIPPRAVGYRISSFASEYLSRVHTPFVSAFQSAAASSHLPNAQIPSAVHQRPTYNKFVHSATVIVGVIHKLTVKEFVDHTNTPITWCGEIF